MLNIKMDVGQGIGFHSYITVAQGGGEQFASDTIYEGGQTQVLNRQEVGWATEGVLKLQRKENSLSLAHNQTPILQPTSHSLSFHPN
jgi:hypothetical protein